MSKKSKMERNRPRPTENDRKGQKKRQPVNDVVEKSKMERNRQRQTETDRKGQKKPQPVKDVVEVKQDGGAGDFDDVVKRFAGVISDAGVGIAEAGEDRRDQLAGVRVAVATQRDRRRRKPDQTAWMRTKTRD